MRAYRGIGWWIAFATGLAAPGTAQAGPIEDNSFLIEEAYNQEPGVIQHISAFMLDRDSETWVYTFTEEWPVLSRTNQASITVPLLGDGSDPELGDVQLNYRYQAVDSPRLAVAPRLTAILPTGPASPAGAGGFGLQVNLPVSATLVPQMLVGHANLGATMVPSAADAADNRAATWGLNGGASLIWLVGAKFNVMLETAYTRNQAVAGPDMTDAQSSLWISPGLRGAIDIGKLQIVPGVAVPIGAGPSEGDVGVFAYLSFEHLALGR